MGVVRQRCLLRRSRHRLWQIKRQRHTHLPNQSALIIQGEYCAFGGWGVGAPDNRSFVAGIAARYGTRLRRFLSVRLRNAADVPDLAQEVFLRLLRVNGCESIRSPEAYLFTIASHVIHQHAVRRSSEPVSVDVADVFSELKTSASDDPSDQAAHAQRLDELEHMLGFLPPRVATALVLHRVAGYSVQEVADELGVSRETAKKYLARAVEHCRNLRANQNMKP
jgi:RNA polymerase sigma factor (sigma-70 family)